MNTYAHVEPSRKNHRQSSEYIRFSATQSYSKTWPQLQIKVCMYIYIKCTHAHTHPHITHTHTHIHAPEDRFKVYCNLKLHPDYLHARKTVSVAAHLIQGGPSFILFLHDGKTAIIFISNFLWMSVVQIKIATLRKSISENFPAFLSCMQQENLNLFVFIQDNFFKTGSHMNIYLHGAVHVLLSGTIFSLWLIHICSDS